MAKFWSVQLSDIVYMGIKTFESSTTFSLKCVLRSVLKYILMIGMKKRRFREKKGFENTSRGCLSHKTR